MIPDRDQQVSEIFLKAIEMSRQERDSHLTKLCGDDDDLRREVESLLAHHSPKELIQTRPDRSNPTSTNVVTLDSNVLPSIGKRKSPRRLVRYSTVAFLIIVGVSLFSFLVTRSVKIALQKNVNAQLQSMVQSDVALIEFWMANQMRMARNWANHPDVRDSLAKQASLSQQEGLTTAQLETTASHDSFLRTIAPLLNEPGVKFVGVFATDGHGIAKCRNPPVEDVHWSAQGAGFIAPCFQGETVFIPSFQAGSNVIGRPHGGQAPTVSVVVPVRDQSQSIIAAMQINMRVDEHFADLFAVGRFGDSGEAYAFDRLGIVLTNLRHDQPLKELGLIPANGSTALNLRLRDPGSDLREGHGAKLDVDQWPLTKVPGRAISAGYAIDVDGYRNYLGAEVIGAAKWLPEYQFGIAREINYAEAYEPLNSLAWLFRALLGLLICTVALMATTMLSNWVLRREAEEAHVLGQYKLGESIGQGGMGQVFKATHAFLRRPAAIKLIRANDVDEDSVKRFEREVQLTSELKHPNTIQIYDYGRRQDGVFYFAMEFLDGMTLSDLVVSEGPVSPSRTIHILRQVCASLREAHHKRLLHRDIKPANIMICEQGGEPDFVKVLDFGLVKQFSESGDREITRVRQLSGTPLCIAPERIRDPFSMDPRSDIYSVGIVGYFMLTGRYPFDGETTIDVLYEVMNGPNLDSLTGSRSDVPAVLDELIMRCLAKQIDERPANMQEVVELLDAMAVDWPWSRDLPANSLELSLMNRPATQSRP